MPFTFSHPAASVPLKRYGLPLSALVVGSMAPDFEYFLRLSPKSHFGHSLLGVLTFCLPAGLLVLWLFHAYLKYPLFTLLPAYQQSRVFPVLRRFSCRSLQDIALSGGAILAGAWTHIGWDAFTHKDGLGVFLFPVLRSSLVITSLGAVPIYRLLQHGSSIVGAIALGVWYLKWLKTAPENSVPQDLHVSNATKIASVGVLGGIAGLTGVFYAIVCLPPIHDVRSFKRALVGVVVTSISCLFVETLLFSLGWRSRRRRSRRGEVAQGKCSLLTVSSGNILEGP